MKTTIMSRSELFTLAILTWFLILICNGTNWALLYTNQNASSELINKMDQNSTKARVADKKDFFDALNQISAQVSTGLTKSDGIASQSTDLGGQNHELAKQIKELAEQIKGVGIQTKEVADQTKTLTEQNVVMLQDIKSVTAQHTADIKKAAIAATRSSAAAESTEVATKHAVRVLTQPKPSWWQRLTRPSPTPRR